MDWITHAGVGRDAVVFKIGSDSVLLKSDVFQHRAKLDGLVDLRLTFWT